MSRLAILLVAVLSTAALNAPGAAAAVPDGMPSQEAMDGLSPSSASQGSWADLSDGTAVRPYIKRLTVVNGADARTAYTGGPGGLGPTETGDVTAVVSPTNLCHAGQSGNCYATPNRVGIAFGYVGVGGNVGRDFAHPQVPLRQTVGPDTILDVVIGLNQLGRSVRWSWGNGDLQSWKTTGLGTADGEIHVRVKPALTPELDWSQHPANGCTATPIRDCELAQADAEFLSAEMLLSLDGTLPDALTGAAFFTQHAILGFLQPGGTSADPILDLQMASSHLQSDGSPQLGTLQAVLPAAGLQSLYGVTPQAATRLFSATRVGDPGTSSPPAFTSLDDSDLDSAGLLVTIHDITFSAPTYRLAKRGSRGGAGTAGAGPSARMVKVSPKRVVVAVSGLKRGLAKATLIVGGHALGSARANVSARGVARFPFVPTAAGQRIIKRAKSATLRLVLPGPKRRVVILKLR